MLERNMQRIIIDCARFLDKNVHGKLLHSSIAYLARMHVVCLGISILRFGRPSVIANGDVRMSREKSNSSIDGAVALT